MRVRLGIPADAPVLVCVARMIARKGQDTLVRVWPLVLREVPTARLLLVGDGPHRATVERLARDLAVTDSVTFTGSVPWDEVPAHIDAGDVFAMPCRTRLFGLEPEAFGIVFLEAQACGLPVVIGDSGGAPETLMAEDNGTVVDSGDLLAVSRAVVGGLVLRRRPARIDAPLVPDWSMVSAELVAILGG